MTQEVINVGAYGNDGTGDPLRTSFVKINNNFSQLFGTIGTSDALFSGNTIVTTNTNSNLNIQPNGGGFVALGPYNKLFVSNTATSSSSATGALIVAGGIGSTTAYFDAATVGSITAVGNFIGNLSGTATNSTLATSATYATTSGLATNALNYAGTALPNVLSVGSNISLNNAGTVTVNGNVHAYKYITGIQQANLSVTSNIAVGNNIGVVIFDSTAGATISTGNIAFPANANCIAGQMITLTSNITVTTLSISAGSGTLIKGSPSTIDNVTSYRWIFYRPDRGTATWLRA